VLGEFSPKGKRYNAAVEGSGTRKDINRSETTYHDRRRGQILAPSRSRGAFLFVLSVSGADSIVRCLSFCPEPNNAVPSGFIERLSLSKSLSQENQKTERDAANPPSLTLGSRQADPDAVKSQACGGCFADFCKNMLYSRGRVDAMRVQYATPVQNQVNL
jgi:hypothetical protein